MTDQKAQDKKDKADFALAVMLIQKQDGVKLADARFRAWLEGPKGLQKRLGQTDLPIDDATQGKVSK